MREPSLHITRTNLIKVIGNYFDNDIFPAEEIADSIMKAAAPYSISSRSISITNDRIEKKAKKILASTRNDANLFAQLLQLNRQKLRHRGVRQIKPNSREWGMIKELAGMALDFSNEFEIERKEGFRIFIQIGLSKMKKFQLNKLLNMYEGICEDYEGKQAILNDPNREFTDKLYKEYVSLIIQKTGIDVDYSEPSTYKYFIEAAEIANKHNLSASIYVKAQFAGFEWRDGYPAPVQLTGTKATQRLNKYLYENNINTKKEKRNIDFSKIMNA